MVCRRCRCSLVDVDAVDAAPDPLVVSDQGGGAVRKNPEFLFDQCPLIIPPSGPVSPRIFPDPAENGIKRALKHRKSMDPGDCRDVLGLALVARNAVQDQHVSGMKAGAVKKEGDDLFG